MSFCAGSSCICFHAASCAFATSASLPTVGVPVCCPSAVSCCKLQRKTWTQLQHDQRVDQLCSGAVPDAAELCRWSNGSPLDNFCFALLHRLSSVLPEPPSPTRRLSAHWRQRQIPASARFHRADDAPRSHCRRLDVPSKFAPDVSPSPVVAQQNRGDHSLSPLK